jgi:cytochrome c-type biogenesis protein CcmE
MSKKMIRVLLAVVVIGGAFATLLATTMRESAEYYKHVDEVMATPEAWYGKNLKLHGFVAKDSILRKRESLDYRFVVHSKGRSVPASYTGVVPDTFKSDAEVVLTGKLGPHGFEVEPNGVMAKCPSKYDASPNAPVKAPEHARPAVTAS